MHMHILYFPRYESPQDVLGKKSYGDGNQIVCSRERLVLGESEQVQAVLYNAEPKKQEKPAPCDLVLTAMFAWQALSQSATGA